MIPRFMFSSHIIGIRLVKIIVNLNLPMVQLPGLCWETLPGSDLVIRSLHLLESQHHLQSTAGGVQSLGC